ncbi:hypothetical protein TNCV_4760191 [Trichonephila clavipes]|uniref:Uncharacterized protein n=1 Tax=Trichonephila clavipes TaxID=2585209 RepID=A0A8X6REG5_TRICX|nr:hypothetical protein TNCV_4760191 [Trichonephila clavipes]
MCILFFLRRAKSIIFTFVDKSAALSQTPKILGKPRETLENVGLIPRHLEKTEAVARFHRNTGHELLEYTSTGFTCLMTRPAHLQPSEDGWRTQCLLQCTR